MYVQSCFMYLVQPLDVVAVSVCVSGGGSREDGVL